jgi:hypothetical protein
VKMQSAPSDLPEEEIAEADKTTVDQLEKHGRTRCSGERNKSLPDDKFCQCHGWSIKKCLLP